MHILIDDSLTSVLDEPLLHTTSATPFWTDCGLRCVALFCVGRTVVLLHCRCSHTQPFLQCSLYTIWTYGARQYVVSFPTLRFLDYSAFWAYQFSWCVLNDIFCQFYEDVGLFGFSFIPLYLYILFSIFSFYFSFFPLCCRFVIVLRAVSFYESASHWLSSCVWWSFFLRWAQYGRYSCSCSLLMIHCNVPFWVCLCDLSTAAWTWTQTPVGAWRDASGIAVVTVCRS